MEYTAYLSLGTNMGDRENYLRDAVLLLQNDSQLSITSVSSIYETDPVGYVEQERFLNIVLEVKTAKNANELLHKCQQIELQLGRKREIRWGPRTIDLDILLYNHENIETESLSIPHPRMHERAFVLVPLIEINPGLSLPKIDKPLSEILEAIPDKEGVRLWKRKNGEGVFALFEN
ncbi:2-amino-4-hydroxy-6-hydroxymethyldihydropteridine diphosphokinase [Peribacillus deserti]|uniref:2-amino-4-hydroxy-6-hydroxymethyldihydropteridine diphosphokinase n=1 Tax=Peribacillus deserti TaxID=673318 RepID=A0ABS2QNW4_9BACI|nr:2-amino-4-hydroxy-6-hydroxymethyldihydropteridine diphosphokinase [Peribacillus deserti]MBM7694877.1 2-amino-4-hydroxy-6-hydroxymethyldihydropteridine diphosphokinase [Peribacillus deserti]